jgi:hypothetical protein
MGWDREQIEEEAAATGRMIRRLPSRISNALDRLHKACAGLEAVGPKNLLPAEMITATRQQLFDIREAILQLMDHYRG